MITPEVRAIQDNYNRQLTAYLELMERGPMMGYFRELVREIAAHWNLTWDQASRKAERDFWGQR